MTDDEIDQEKMGDIAILSDPSYQDWEWHIWRFRTKTELAADPQGGVRELIEKRVGPIDVFELREQLGGGVFELWGFFNNGDGGGKRLRKKPVFTFAGPRKRYDVPILPTPAPAAVPQAPASDPALIRILDRIDMRLDQLKDGTGSKAPTLKDMADTLMTLDALRKRGDQPVANPEREIVNTYFAMVEKGIELGQQRDPSVAPTGTDWAKVFELGLPLIDRLISRYGQIRRPPPRPAPSPGDKSTPSAAAVVDQPNEVPEMNHRWPTAIESLANAIADGEDPREFAITLEHILNKQEIGQLRLATLDQVMSELQVAFETYPILKTDQARMFIEALLAEIKNPTPPEVGQ